MTPRWPALTFFVGSLALLALLVWLRPDPRGFGTHEQLALPPCGFFVETGIPCPFCGMTTSLCHLFQGNVGQAFLVHPVGALLGGILGFTLVYSLVAFFRHRPVFSSALRARWRWALTVLLSLCAAGWFYKIAVHVG